MSVPDLLSILLFLIRFEVLPGAVVHLECPRILTVNAVNDITYKVDRAGIVAANCSFFDRVDFSFKNKNSTTLSPLTHCTYPPTSCSNTVTSGQCGCTYQESQYYNYTLKFFADESHTGGQLTAIVCVNPRGPYGETASEFCNYINFVDVCKGVDCESGGVCHPEGNPPEAKCKCPKVLTRNVGGKCKNFLPLVIVLPIVWELLGVAVIIIFYKKEIDLIFAVVVVTIIFGIILPLTAIVILYLKCGYLCKKIQKRQKPTSTQAVQKPTGKRVNEN